MAVPLVVVFLAVGAAGWYYVQSGIPFAKELKAYLSSSHSFSSARNSSQSSQSQSFVSSSLSLSSFSSSNLSSSSLSSLSSIASSSSSQATSKAKECYSVQFLYGYEKFKDKIQKYAKKLERLGFSSCYIQTGKRLPNGSRRLFLRCGIAEHIKDLKGVVQKAKSHRLDYFIVSVPCQKSFAASSSLSTSSSSASLVQSSRASNSSLAIILLAKDQNISELEALFSKRRSYPLALQIARYYMEVGEYRKALKWAKAANRIDRKKEEAWILYAKALKALGHLKEAKQILQVFLQYQNSPKAQKLLKEWR